MNMRIMTEQEVLGKVDRHLVMSALRSAFLGLFKGTTVQPPQIQTPLPDSEGDCIFYPGLVSDLGLVGVAISPFIAQRISHGLSPVTAYTLLLSTSTGEPVLFCDAKALTAVRTAAVTLLAVNALAPSASRLAIVGAGPLGIEHAACAAQIRTWNSIEIVSPSICDKNTPKHETRMVAVKGIGNGVRAGSSIEKAVREAEVVMLCTNSGTAVVEKSWLEKVALLTSISTDAPLAHEINPKWLDDFDVFCDYRNTAPATAGEMVIAIEASSWSAGKIVADLPEMIGGAWQLPDGSDSRLRYFRSIGLGIEDIAAASTLI